MKIESEEFFWNNVIAKHSFVRQFYPRRILAPHDYYNPAYASLTMFGSVFTASQVPPQDRGTSTITETVYVADQLLKYQMPVYFIEPDLAMACNATSLPEGMTFDDIKMPMPAMVLMFHDRFIRAGIGRLVPFVMCCKFTESTMSHPLISHVAGIELSLEVAVPMFFVVFPHYIKVSVSTPDADNRVHYTNPIYSSHYPLRRLLSDIKDEQLPFSTDDEELGAYFGTEVKKWMDEEKRMLGPGGDRDLLEKVTALTVKLLLTITARPSLIGSSGGIARKEKIKKGIVVKEELWHPNIIGLGYKLKKAVSEGTGEGTHASPKMHWRKGHWHHVVHGKGRALRKLDWFEPVLVNPPS